MANPYVKELYRDGDLLVTYNTAAKMFALGDADGLVVLTLAEFTQVSSAFEGFRDNDFAFEDDTDADASPEAELQPEQPKTSDEKSS